jgi:hypothetical protein
MTSTERLLAWYLRFAAFVLVLALPAVFFPHRWMDAVHNALGMGSLPELPMVGYLTRSNSAMCAFLGVLLAYLSFDLRRYRPLLLFLSVVHGLFGIVLLGVDLAVNMPGLWVLAEGPVIVAWAVLLNLLARRIPAA